MSERTDYGTQNNRKARPYPQSIEGANLSEAILAGAYVEANLEDADLSDTNCRAAYFVGANLNGTNFEGADLTYAYFDENEDEYDDVSYDAGAESGDVNLEGTNDVLDVVAMVYNILNP